MTEKDSGLPPEAKAPGFTRREVLRGALVAVGIGVNAGALLKDSTTPVGEETEFKADDYLKLFDSFPNLDPRI